MDETSQRCGKVERQRLLRGRKSNYENEGQEGSEEDNKNG